MNLIKFRGYINNSPFQPARQTGKKMKIIAITGETVLKNKKERRTKEIDDDYLLE